MYRGDNAIESPDGSAVDIVQLRDAPTTLPKIVVAIWRRPGPCPKPWAGMAERTLTRHPTVVHGPTRLQPAAMRM